jgi:peptide/nickel transport system substrate-binding protein
MKFRMLAMAAAGMAALGLSLALAPEGQAQSPKRGGQLVFTVPASNFPSMDGHRETTFALIHPVAPIYSLLVRIDPNDPQAKKIVGDLAESWTVSADKKTYTYKLKKGVKFHDGSPLTAKDVVASFNHIINPPEGVLSARKAYFVMVDSVSNTDDHTVVFKLKYPSGSFIPSLAQPFNWIYKAEILAKDPRWYEKNAMGSGPFRVKENNPGANFVGERNPNYHVKGLPLLDGYEAIFTPKENVELQAMRGERSMIQFRGFPPEAESSLKTALGDKIQSRESPWNCMLYAVPNPEKKPFDDVRVRRALNLAIDRWGGSQYLSKTAIVKTVGSYVFPGHELAMSEAELKKVPGYWPDIEASRKEARRLLKEAGVPEGFRFKLHNRNTDQPYKYVGTWLIDQWRQVGLNVEQVVLPTAPFYEVLRARQFDVSIDFNCQTIVNPTGDISKFISADKSGSNEGKYIDRKLDDLYEAQLKEGDPEKQKKIIREFELYLNDTGYYMTTLWWNRIVVNNSKVKAWNISPSHYINNQLDNVWLQ